MRIKLYEMLNLVTLLGFTQALDLKYFTDIFWSEIEKTG